MARACPSPTDKNYKKLTELLEGDTNAAYRMWKIHEELYPGQGEIKALETFSQDYSVKLGLITSNAKNLQFDEESHTYTWEGDPSIQISSMSSQVDTIPELRTRVIESLPIYSESGTRVHKLFQHIVNSSEPGKSEAVLTFAKDNNIPESLVNGLIDLKNKLSKMGSLVSEIKLFAEGDNVKIGGHSDLIIYGKDGKKYIVDLKTVYHTPSTRKKPDNDVWDPFAHNMQKAKRYAVQVMGYGRMTEYADNQAVSDHFIVPIELEFNDESDLSKGYKFAKVRDIESIKKWGVTSYATRALDVIFGKTSSPPSISAIIGSDDSSNIYHTLTGTIAEHVKDPIDQARRIRRSLRNGVFGYLDAVGNFKAFTSQDRNDDASHNAQIINEYINITARINNDLALGLANYIESGNENYLRSLGNRTEILKSSLRQFVGRKDLKIVNLQDIKGLESKKNWILIEDDQVRHLMYIGAEDLTMKFNTKGVANTSLFGKFGDKTRTTRINSALRNTLGDARKFEGTLIALKLKEADPNITFGYTAVYGVGTGSVFGDAIDLAEGLETIRNIVNDPYMRHEVFGGSPELIKLASKKETLDPDQYRANYLHILTSFVNAKKNMGESIDGDLQKLVSQLENLSKDQSKRAEMLYRMNEYFNDKVRMGRSVNTDDATFLLSQFYLQFQELDPSLLPINVYNKLISMQQNVANPLLQKLDQKLNNAVNDMARRFRSEYKDGFNKKLEALLKSKNIDISVLGIQGYAGLSAMTDVLSPIPGTNARHFDNLFVKGKRKIVTDQGDKEIDYNTFNLKMPGTPEFNALTPAEQEFIVEFNKVLKHFADINNIKWVEGRVPLVRGTVANRLRSARLSNVPGSYQKIVNDMLIDLESSFGSSDQYQGPEGNIFHAQENDEKFDKREAMLGVQADGYLNQDDYLQWSTDLESVMDVFAIQGLRYQVFNDIGASLKAANAIFQWNKSNLLEERIDGLIDWVNIVKTVNLDNRDVDSGTVLNRASRLAAKISSIGLYAFNPATAITSYIGNELTMLSESIANSITGTGRFSSGSIMKAKYEMTKIFGQRTYDPNALEKTGLLMRKFRMFNEDISSFLNGYHKIGDKFLFRSKYMFSMLSGADYATRMNIMIAQMIEDGSWDAYTVVDGELKYDESKDGRFNGTKLDTKKGRALREAIAFNNGDDPTKPLTDGYDDNMYNSLRATANYLLGTNDREARSLINFMWTGKVFMASKNWLTAKVDRWILGIGQDKTVQSGLTGSYDFQEDENGNMHAYWKGDQLEGIIMSWLAAIDNVRRAKDQRVPLTANQKANIMRSLSDLTIVMSSLAVLTAIGLGDDREKNKYIRASALEKMYRNALDDLLTMYTVAANPTFLWHPVGLDYMANAMSRGFKALYNQDANALLKVIPIADELDRYYQLMFDENFEITIR